MLKFAFSCYLVAIVLFLILTEVLLHLTVHHLLGSCFQRLAYGSRLLLPWQTTWTSMLLCDWSIWVFWDLREHVPLHGSLKLLLVDMADTRFFNCGGCCCWYLCSLLAPHDELVRLGSLMFKFNFSLISFFSSFLPWCLGQVIIHNQVLTQLHLLLVLHCIVAEWFFLLAQDRVDIKIYILLRLKLFELILQKFHGQGRTGSGRVILPYLQIFDLFT